MKKPLLTAVCVIAFAFGVSAQVPTPFSLYAGGALSLPNAPDDFKDSFKTGYHGLVGLGYKMGPGFQLVGKAEYHKFAFDFAGLSGVDGGDSKMWMFGGDGRLAFDLPAAPIKPFAFVGIGIANIKQSEFGGNVTLATALNDALPDTQNKVYYNIGAGVELKAGPSFNLFVQGRYVSIATEGNSTSFIPITVGLKF
ncbi:MAG: porin family protein, partial [candidate division Zixibacteria bacterium]|nr:porin family protein [candidate division Zixibacteria bacterium]